VVKVSGVGEGLCTLFSRHTTVGLTIQENEPRLIADIIKHIEALAPKEGQYLHDDITARECPPWERPNAHAHLKSLLIGPSVSIPVHGGELALGTYQAILAIEADGPRERREIMVAVSGEAKRHKIEAYLEEVKPLIFERARGLFPFTEEEFGPMVKDIEQRLAGGKFLRGGITMMVGERLGVSRDKCLNYAANVEMLHQSTIIHDDVIDEHHQRRGLLPLWVPLGVRQAVAVGDRLFALIQKRVAALGRREHELFCTALDEITQGILMELNPVEFLFDLVLGRVKKKAYLKLIRTKTAVLFKTAAVMGVLASGREELEDDLASFGLNLGSAFQIADDVVDLVKAEGGETKLLVGLGFMLAHYDALPLLEIITALRKRQWPTVSIPYNEVRQRALAEIRGYIDEAKDRVRKKKFKRGYGDMLSELPSYCCEAILSEANLGL